jgi:serine/threonine protein kinase
LFDHQSGPTQAANIQVFLDFDMNSSTEIIFIFNFHTICTISFIVTISFLPRTNRPRISIHKSSIIESEESLIVSLFRAMDGDLRYTVAIKVPMIGSQQTSVEGHILRKLNHLFIIALLNVVATEDGPALVFPHAPGNDLFKHAVSNDGLSESDARAIRFRLLSAVSHCHAHGIVHRDIKLENILVMSDNIQDVVLADFGCATDCPCAEECSGTVEDTPSEIWKRSPCTEKVNIWSLGIILFILIVADYPYVISDGADPIECISEGLASLDQHQALRNTSHECRDLLGKMLEPDPNHRISADEAILHPWFSPLSIPASKRGSSSVNKCAH